MNGAGTTVEWRDYYPFGLAMPGRSYLSGTAAKEGFTGKERDAETGLDYFGARYYLPALGRWGSVDPLAQDPAQVDKSPYAYSWNNPATLTDPDGRCPKCLKTAYNVVKRAYNAAENAGDMRQLFKLDTWKKAGLDEIAGAVDNLRTLTDGQLTVDDAIAVVDLVTGLGDEAKAVGKAAGVVEEAGDLQQGARFIGDTDGKVIDLQATPKGTYVQPSGQETDILQKSPHFNKAAGRNDGTTHTHPVEQHVNPNTGVVYPKRSPDTHPPTREEVENIKKGTAKRKDE